MWACRDAGSRYMRIQDFGNRGRGCRGPDVNAAGFGFSGMRMPRGAGVLGRGFLVVRVLGGQVFRVSALRDGRFWGVCPGGMRAVRDAASSGCCFFGEMRARGLRDAGVPCRGEVRLGHACPGKRVFREAGV